MSPRTPLLAGATVFLVLGALGASNKPPAGAGPIDRRLRLELTGPSTVAPGQLTVSPRRCIGRWANSRRVAHEGKPQHHPPPAISARMKGVAVKAMPLRNDSGRLRLWVGPRLCLLQSVRPPWLPMNRPPAMRCWSGTQIFIDTLIATNTPNSSSQRLGAILHTAIFDAYNGIDTALHADASFTSRCASCAASRRAAVIAAAHTALLGLFPSQQSVARCRAMRARWQRLTGLVRVAASSRRTPPALVCERRIRARHRLGR